MTIIERAENDITVFVLKGRIDTQGAVDMSTALQAAVSAGQHKMVVDMAQVPYINSAGLRTLVDVLARNKKAGGDLKLVALNHNVRHIFHIIGFDRVFPIYDALEAAVADF